MSTRNPLWFLAGLAAIAAGCNKSPVQPPGRPPAPVSVATAITSDAPLYLDEIGKVTASEVVTITPQVAGQIKAKHFNDGDEVQADQLLFEINPEPFDAALAQATAQLGRDQAAAQSAQATATRQKQLFDEKATSPQNYDDAYFAFESAKALVTADEAALKNAEINRKWCDIKSPVDGIAGERLVDVGNVVKANEGSLLVVQSIGKVYCDFTVNERDLAAVRESLSAKTLRTLVRLPSDTGDPFSGRPGESTILDNSVQDATGTVKLRATVDNKDKHFWPGQFVTVRLILRVDKDAVMIPSAAPQLGQMGWYVFVLLPGDVTKQQPVVLGQRQKDLIVVKKGLSAGEKVIEDGQIAVIPGLPVHVIPPATQPSEVETVSAAEDSQDSMSSATRESRADPAPGTRPATGRVGSAATTSPSIASGGAR